MKDNEKTRVLKSNLKLMTFQELDFIENDLKNYRYNKKIHKYNLLNKTQIKDCLSYARFSKKIGELQNAKK